MSLGRLAGLSSDTSSKEPACQCRRRKRCGLDLWVREDSLKEGMATHSSILALRIPWTEESGRLQSTGSQSWTWRKWLSTHVQKARTRTKASLVAQTVKNLPAMQETWIQSLGWEDPLEEGIAIHSSILAWSIPMDRGAWQGTIHGVAKSRTRLSDQGQHTAEGA